MRSTKNNFGERRVVVTGMGTINPIGNNVQEFWENLTAGKSGVRTAQHTDLSEFNVRIGGEVDFPDNIGDFFPKKLLKRVDRFIVFGHVAAVQAYKDAGLEPSLVEKNPFRFGAVIGTGDAGNGLHFEMCKRIQKQGMESVSPYYAVGVIPNMPPAFFAKEFHFQGPNFSVNSACATSNHAIISAMVLIKAGAADVMICGGTEGVLNEAGYSGFSIIYALSRRNDSPETASRPFDKDRDGFVLSEGAGVLCLEELEFAKKRGANIYAELKGFGLSCDAYDLVAPDPEGKGAAAAMALALQNAQLNKGDIELINAHGTSTILGDVAESRAIRQVFGERTDQIYVHSTKSMIGHLIGAASGTEAIASILAIQKGIVHPSINLFEMDPEIDLNIPSKAPVEFPVNNVLSNSFGFGGQNASLIISRFTG
ncbi:MAG: beta-ketoacyl-ACP synthase II [Candidatus Aminicenantes bacterium]|nr:beta-ketoacyl-ACP synthase II [Candidatus Aminicenantes bacterium]